jgi:hypothetical protein
LSQAIDFLIKRGHKEQDIIERYSMDKIYLYIEAGQKNAECEMHQQAIAARMGVNADGKDFSKWLTNK